MNELSSSTRQLADRLSAMLFSGGYYKFADYERQSSPTNFESRDALLPTSSESFIGDSFAGISVAAVGFNDTPGDERIFVYAPRTNKKLVKQFPAEIEGTPATLSSIGNVDVRPDAARTNTNSPKCYTDHNDRITCGSSTAPSGASYAGTFGALVEKDGNLYALSNNHVFGECNHTPDGYPILCPSAIDVGRGLPHPRTLFTHSGLVPLHSGDPHHVDPAELDASIAQVIDPQTVSSQQGRHFDTPPATRDPRPSDTVKKVGRTTGLTFGVVESQLSGVFPLPYKTPKFKATVYFTNVWLVRGVDENFALPGDSGSLVVTEDEEHSLGLVFAVTTLGVAVIAPIDPVLEFLEQAL